MLVVSDEAVHSDGHVHAGQFDARVTQATPVFDRSSASWFARQ